MAGTSGNETLEAASDSFAALGALVAVAVGAILATQTRDSVMWFHAILLLAAGAVAFTKIVSDTFGAGPPSTAPASVQHLTPTGAYNDGVVRAGVIATVFWGIAGFLAGDVLAWQLAYPALNLDLPWTNFGRLRPLHTSAVVFAFGGNALIATSFYVVQRTCRARLAGRWAPWFVFWGYQLFLVMAATGYLLGVTQGKEYAEPEWYVDIWLTIVWVVYLLVFLGTIWRRQEPHIYVANWFYLAFIVTVAMLHIVNNLAVPVEWTGTKSYQIYSGVQDAMTQWWYGHNAVGFFLTAGFLAMMYYFHSQARRAADLLLPSLYRAFLVADLPLYLGGTASSALHRASRLGADPRHDVFHYALDAILGWHDQWADDALGRLGQAAYRPRSAPDGGFGRLLRHVHIRGPGDEHQGHQLA